MTTPEARRPHFIPWLQAGRVRVVNRVALSPHQGKGRMSHVFYILSGGNDPALSVDVELLGAAVAAPDSRLTGRLGGEDDRSALATGRPALYLAGPRCSIQGNSGLRKITRNLMLASQPSPALDTFMRFSFLILIDRFATL